MEVKEAKAVIFMLRWEGQRMTKVLQVNQLQDKIVETLSTNMDWTLKEISVSYSVSAVIVETQGSAPKRDPNATNMLIKKIKKMKRWGGGEGVKDREPYGTGLRVNRFHSSYL